MEDQKSKINELVNLCSHPIKIGEIIIPVSEYGVLRLIDSEEKRSHTSRFLIGDKEHEITLYAPMFYEGLYLENNPYANLYELFDGKAVIVNLIVAEYWKHWSSTTAYLTGNDLRFLPDCEVLVPNTRFGHFKITDDDQIETDSLCIYVANDEVSKKLREGLIGIGIRRGLFF